MRHIVFARSETYPIALLIKGSAFYEHELRGAYLAPLTQRGVAAGDVVAMTLAYNEAGKAPVKLIKAYLEELLPELDSIGTQTLYCADAAYFKVLTKQTKAEPHLGYVLPCAIEGFEHMRVILGVNHKSLLYNPANEAKLDLSLDTLADSVEGTHQAPGEGIIHSAEYPVELGHIDAVLAKLHQYPELTCDIEAFSLRFEEAGIGTIGFAWNEHEGVAFPVDYASAPMNDEGLFGIQHHNPQVKRRLREFFETYQGTLIWHSSTYDTKVLIYELWMKDLLDTEGLLKGLEVLHARLHDTKIITYLATNSCAGNHLGLKDQAHEFAGNYAQEDIKDIRKIPLEDLLEYNLVDCLSTWYTYKKRWPEMVAAEQEEIYYGLMLPSLETITQMELTGMPLDPAKVADARLELESIVDGHRRTLFSKPIIQQLEERLTQEAWQKDYEKRRNNAKNPDKILPKPRDTFPRMGFNPNSGPQLQKLLFEEMGLPVLDLTDTKQPATGKDTLDKLVHHTDNPDYLDILEALKGHAEAEKILSAFIPAFERAIDKGDGVVYLHGSFNLGGTKSGRLSSSDPNLQNIPAGSTYGKLIKSCFVAPKGWLFAGADFNSLEDYISALTTKDPNKLKVYLEGYDGHTLRAFSYWPEKFPFTELTPELSHKAKKDPVLEKVRGKSKGPTFALTYQGTWHTLVNNLGFDPEMAKAIEANYHELYKVSDQYVQDKLRQASNDGYVEVAFGLRLRTPLLARTYRGKSSTPYEAEAEGRTAGNALGQSYGLLTNRAANAFMKKVRTSKYRHDVKLVAMIHDAIYLLMRDNLEVVAWVNRELIKEMRWQELPEIQHDQVKLGAELDIFYPSWASAMTVPNDATAEEIRALSAGFLQQLNEKEAA